MDERKTALIFKAFCDENRIRILKMLKDGEKCACKLLEALNVGLRIWSVRSWAWAAPFVEYSLPREGSGFA